MRVLAFDRFQLVGQAALSTPGVAVAIAPGSEIDTCKVGDYVLGVGSVVPWQPTVTPTRGFRIQDNDGITIDPKQPGRLELLVFECAGEIWAPAGRAPTSRSVLVPTGSIGTTALTATRIMRLPFFGRRQATFFIRRRDAAADTNIVIRGIKYLPRELIAKFAAAGPFGNLHWTDEITDSIFAGGAGQPASSINGGGFGTDFPDTAPQPFGSALLGRSIHIGGGGDLQECYEELELWVWGAAGNTDLHAYAESYGERIL